MNFNEALQVLRRINVHHGNAPISDAQAQCFYEELARSVSFDEANTAYGNSTHCILTANG